MSSMVEPSAKYETSDSVFNSVVMHHVKYKDVTSTQGAFAFNQAFLVPVEMEKIAPPSLTVSVIDAVQRKEKVGTKMMIDDDR